MNKDEQLILELIKEGISLNDIQVKLNMKTQEFSKHLVAIRNYGYMLKRVVQSDGRIFLHPNKNINPNQFAEPSFRLNVKDRFFKALVISDLHFGSNLERTYLMKYIYNYAQEHDIHIIFALGDLIDNIYPNSNQILKNKTVPSQINKIIRLYPENPYIITLSLSGNHEYKSVLDEGLNIGQSVENQRYDIISLGYGLMQILLKDDKIALIHDIKKTRHVEIPKDISISYKGHSHKSKNSFKDHKVIYCPALSVTPNGYYEYKPLIGFLETEFSFLDKKIERVNIRQLAIVNKNIRLANEEAIILRKKNNCQPTN